MIKRITDLYWLCYLNFTRWRVTRKLCQQQLCGTCAGFIASGHPSSAASHCSVRHKEDLNGEFYTGKWVMVDIGELYVVDIDTQGCKWWTAITKTEYRSRRKHWAYYIARGATKLSDKETYGSQEKERVDTDSQASCR